MRTFFFAIAATTLVSSVVLADEPATKKLSPKGQQMLGKLGLGGL